MRRWIGLDAHAASWTLAIVAEAGKGLRDFPVETNGAALVEAVCALPSPRHLIFEEGTHSAWLYETWAPHVEEIVVIGVRTIRGSRSDARDAYALAEKLRTHAVDQSVFKAPKEFAVLRELARVHGVLVRDVVRVQARLKSIYRSRAIATTGATVSGHGNGTRGRAGFQPPRAIRRRSSTRTTIGSSRRSIERTSSRALRTPAARSPT